jgi:hypothetical protein
MSSGASRLPEADRAALDRAWSEGRLVLFLGAGASQPYGLPSWSDLVLTLLVDEYETQLSDIWAHYRRPFSAWLAERYQLTPAMLARLSHWKFADGGYATSPTAFAEYLRKILYGRFSRPAKSTLLTAVADLIERSERSGRKIPRVITLNYDSLLEEELAARRVDCVAVHSPDRQAGSALPILHPHGYLPRNGPLAGTELVFGEDEYHRLSFDSVHWAQVEMLSTFRNCTVLFMGLSMSDPNLRRLLDATRIDGVRAHFLLRMRYTLPQPQRDQAFKTITEQVRSAVADSGLPLKEEPSFTQAIDFMLDRLVGYDEQLFGDLGTNVIWYDHHDDVSGLVDEIGTMASEAPPGLRAPGGAPPV